MSSLKERQLELNRQSDEDQARAQFVTHLVAMALDPAPSGSPGAERVRADRVRQVAMYLTHVGFALPLRRVATAFGRDRATVGHACNRVEDLREDPAFDALLLRLEACVRAAPSASFP
jgi:chromosomal replication initiation ATPase DnaA